MQKEKHKVTVLNGRDGKEHLSDTQMPVWVLGETGATQRRLLARIPGTKKHVPICQLLSLLSMKAISQAHEISLTSLCGYGPGQAILCSDAGLGIRNIQPQSAGEGSCLVMEHIFSGDLEGVSGATQVGCEHNTHRKAKEHVCHSRGV